MVRSLLALLCAGATCLTGAPAEGDLPRDSAPPLLDHGELIRFAGSSDPDPALREKLDALLHTPFISNDAYFAGVRPHRPIAEPLGAALRAAVWNIERGSEFDLIRLALGDPEGFLAAIDEREGAKLDEIRDQARLLWDSDVLILNEVDLGMTRSEYRDVAKELAAALGMNYAFGVEFVEVDPIELGLEQIHPPSRADDEQFTRDMAVDPSHYRGLHGTAILSRYPVRDAKILRFRPCYDWYEKEKQEISNWNPGDGLLRNGFSWSASAARCAWETGSR